jgi:hypothetical protein
MDEELEPRLALTPERPGRLRRNPLGKVTGMQKYREFETNLSADKPEFDRIEDPALGELFAEENLALKPGTCGPGLTA